MIEIFLWKIFTKLILLEQEESQVAIDAIMDEVEKKMDCLDAIEKHNQRWENHLSKMDHEPKKNNNVDEVSILTTFSVQKAKPFYIKNKYSFVY